MHKIHKYKNTHMHKIHKYKNTHMHKIHKYKNTHKNGTGNYVEGVVNGRTGSGPVRSTSCETPHDTFKIASWNIGTMRGRSSEIVETITRRNIDLCCMQEVRWRGASARHIIGKDSRYKFFWVGNNQGTSGVGVLLAEKWVDKVYDIKRVADRIMLIKLLVGEVVLTVLSVYAPSGFKR